MIESARVGAILLAAGRSQRFGAKDKLAQEWRGKPLAGHAAETLSTLPFAAHVAVVGAESTQDFPASFKTVINSEPELGLSHSIALGVAALAKSDVDACLIALADMPLVPRSHFSALLDGFDPGSGAILATANGSRAQVPAIFAREHFAELMALSGDLGARDLLRKAASVPCAPELLADFDRPEDFRR